MCDKRVHKLRPESFYNYLRETRYSLLTLSFDCQKKLVLPKVPDQSAYYSRQLYLYNLCFVKGSSRDQQNKENTFIYTWTENQYHEILSALIHRLKNTNFDGIDKLRLMCDGCGGQNKNSIVVLACAKWFFI